MTHVYGWRRGPEEPQASPKTQGDKGGTRAPGTPPGPPTRPTLSRSRLGAGTHPPETDAQACPGRRSPLPDLHQVVQGPRDHRLRHLLLVGPPGHRPDGVIVGWNESCQLGSPRRPPRGTRPQKGAEHHPRLPTGEPAASAPLCALPGSCLMTVGLEVPRKPPPQAQAGPAGRCRLESLPPPDGDQPSPPPERALSWARAAPNTPGSRWAVAANSRGLSACPMQPHQELLWPHVCVLSGASERMNPPGRVTSIRRHHNPKEQAR